MIEHKNLMKGGPPRHFHLRQEEWFYVMEGEVLFEVGDSRNRSPRGESIRTARDPARFFRGVGEKPAHMLIAFTPAGTRSLPSWECPTGRRWTQESLRGTRCNMLGRRWWHSRSRSRRPILMWIPTNARFSEATCLCLREITDALTECGLNEKSAYRKRRSAFEFCMRVVPCRWMVGW